MNQQDTPRTSFASNLLLAVLVSCATVMTACPPDTAGLSDTTRTDDTPSISSDLR